MALSLKVEFSVSNDGKKIYVTDKTGVYSASNTGGWGSPNSTLAQSCLLGLAIRKASSGNQQFTGTSYYFYDNTALNSDETEFEFTFAADGVIDICLVRLPVSTDHTTYVDSGAPVNGSYYYYSGVAGAGPGIYKKEGASYSIVTSANYKLIPYAAGVVGIIYPDICTPQLAIEAQKMYKEYRVEREKDCDDAEPLFSELLKLHEDIRGAYYTFWSNLSAEAQSQVEDLLDKYQISANA